MKICFPVASNVYGLSKCFQVPHIIKTKPLAYADSGP